MHPGVLTSQRGWATLSGMAMEADMKNGQRNDMEWNVPEVFWPGQAVMADGRHGIVAFTDPTGRTFVHTPSGIVPARTVAPVCFGAPRQLQSGGPLRTKGHIGRNVAPVAPIPYCIRLAA